jgi:hypothetical protein
MTRDEVVAWLELFPEVDRVEACGEEGRQEVNVKLIGGRKHSVHISGDNDDDEIWWAILSAMQNWLLGLKRELGVAQEFHYRETFGHTLHKPEHCQFSGCGNSEREAK